MSNNVEAERQERFMNSQIFITQNSDRTGWQLRDTAISRYQVSLSVIEDSDAITDLQIRTGDLGLSGYVEGHLMVSNKVVDHRRLGTRFGIVVPELPTKALPVDYFSASVKDLLQSDQFNEMVAVTLRQRPSKEESVGEIVFAGSLREVILHNLMYNLASCPFGSFTFGMVDRHGQGRLYRQGSYDRGVPVVFELDPDAIHRPLVENEWGKAFIVYHTDKAIGNIIPVVM